MAGRKRALVAGLAGALVAGALMLVPAVPASASSPLGTGPVCDREVPYQLCLSAGGNGNAVSSDDYSSDNAEDTTVAAANVCGGTDVVDGKNTNCPFQSGSNMNTKYSGDVIVEMYNTHVNDDYYLGVPGQMELGPKGTGYLWVLAPISSGSQIYYLISVARSGAQSEPVFACSVGQVGAAIEITSTFSGGGQCEWAMP